MSIVEERCPACNWGSSGCDPECPNPYPRIVTPQEAQEALDAAEQDGLDLVAIKAAHAKHGSRGCLSIRMENEHHCLPYRLAALALDLQQERGHHAAKSELRRAELYGGVGTTAGPLGWVRRASEAEALALDLQGKVARVKAIVRNLDRCEHGRHAIDHCSDCNPSEWMRPSHGNPIDVIGYRVHGRPITVAELLAALADQPEQEKP